MKSGIINVYKEAGYTSFDVIAKLRGILKEKKLGHTGTLDPMAEGVLPVCIGRATKLAGLLTDKPKEYVTEFRLGVRSDTQDVTGELFQEMQCKTIDTCLYFTYDSDTENNNVSDRTKTDEKQSVDALSRNDTAKMVSQEINNALCSEPATSVSKNIKLEKAQIEACIKGFVGKITQLTPMYSARKVNGKKLYEYARAGKEVERSSKTIMIYDISDIKIDMEKALVSMRVLCEKGTYIRTLCNDIGEKLGVGAVMTKLTRTKVDVFSIDNSLKLSEIEKLRDEGRVDAAVIGSDELFSDCTKLALGEELEKYVINGNPLRTDNFEKEFIKGERVRIYDHKWEFMALYREENNQLRCEVLFI